MRCPGAWSTWNCAISQAEIAGQQARSSISCWTATRHRSVALPRVARVAGVVLAGGFPDARSRAPRQRARYLRSYVRTVIGHNLPEIGEVRIDPSKLEQLLELLAARTSGLVNYSALGRELALDEKTVKAHVELLHSCSWSIACVRSSPTSGHDR